jgi:hypothetical protein
VGSALRLAPAQLAGKSRKFALHIHVGLAFGEQINEVFPKRSKSVHDVFLNSILR